MTTDSREEKYMREALKEARKAYQLNEVPIGAVIVVEDKIIARAHNLRVTKKSSLAHAEILAIQKANKKVGDWRLEDAELYVTLEPCPMCAGAIMQARIKTVCYGTKDPKAGSVDSVQQMYQMKGYNHYPEVKSGILEEECSGILKEFFRELRKQAKNK